MVTWFSSWTRLISSLSGFEFIYPFKKKQTKYSECPLLVNIKLTLSHFVPFPLQYLQKLPWESMSILKSHSVSRMPSLHSLVGLCIQKEVRIYPVVQISLISQPLDSAVVIRILFFHLE